MESLDHAVGAGMVRGRPDPLGPEQDHEVAPKFGLELGAAVSRDGVRGAEAGDPGVNEGLGDCRCGDVADGCGLWLSGESVNHRHDVGEAVVHG